MAKSERNMRTKHFKKLRSIYHRFEAYYCDSPYYNNPQIKLHNWCTPAPQDFWLSRFIENRFEADTQKIGVFSVFGLRQMIRLDRSDIKIFLARENVHRSNWKNYDDICLKEKSLDLCIGFDYGIDDERYIRFPLWIMWIFSPNVTYDEVKCFCDRVNSADNSSYDDRSFCVLISSHDDDGRKEIFNEIDTIAPLDSCGKFMHNNNDLFEKYSNNKLELLRHYRFNLCPENSNWEGYCTEKIFEAISGGCVPIYWGSNNNPEPCVLNHNAICFIDVGKPNESSVLEKIRNLNLNKQDYDYFSKQNRLLKEAPDIIMESIEDLENRLRAILKNC